MLLVSFLMCIGFLSKETAKGSAISSLETGDLEANAHAFIIHQRSSFVQNRQTPISPNPSVRKFFLRQTSIFVDTSASRVSTWSLVRVAHGIKVGSLIR
jgi:hypothetical protein